MMGFWDSVTTVGRINKFNDRYGKVIESKTKNFDKYRAEVKKTREYIKSKREAFYKNNNLKER